MAETVFNVAKLSPTLIAGLHHEWRQLLASSRADSLFLDWSWQKQWWEAYSDKLPDAELLTLLVRNDAHQPVGIAGLYAQRVRRLPLTDFRSIQFVGACWRTNIAMLSEYLEPIVESQQSEKVTRELLTHLANLQWDEFVCELTLRDGPFAAEVRSWCSRNGWYLRELDETVSYQAEISSGFDAFIARLSANSRRRLLNNRSRLLRTGKVEIRRYWDADASDALMTLNELHSRRWKQPAYDPERLTFLRALHASLPKHARPLVSVIEVDAAPISALYDIRFPTRQYNIQTGFDPQFDNSLSLGLLHLGYAIENAAADGVSTYDFLGGCGQHTNYKERISTDQRRLVTLQVVRSFPGQAMYRLSDLLRGRKPPRH